MELLVYLGILLVIAAIISLVLSFLGTVLVGALRLLPVVFVALAIAVFVRWYRDRH
ncbi:hypothetical protein [Collinsella sp. An271]|uniref:Uncharacterized protein n=1 Tax=Collinsella ihumii TaxID=1720204 RepID=A0A921IP06_9ACTN|nr:hypothetical protein [Collinsella sp. An271]HJG30905.1 hypothetical protein [Collinsella ihumii]